MKKILLSLTVLMLFVLTSCQQAHPMSKIEIEDFRNKDGEYVFRESRWGMTKQEVDEKLGVKIDDGEEGVSQKTKYYHSIDAEIFGRREKDCTLTYTFYNDTFSELSYEFKGENIEDIRQFYDKTVEKIIEAFGEPQEARELGIIDGEAVRWTYICDSGENYFFSVLFTKNEDTGRASFVVLIGAWMPPE